MLFKPFGSQKEFLLDNHRIRALIASKRSGKSESCYIDTILKAHKQPNYTDNGRDPYLIGMIAPTENMLRRLVFPKFRQFAKPFEKDFNKQDQIFKWNTNNSTILGFTAEKIQRMEGYKLNHIHITEAFQCNEHVFYESLARTSDTLGSIVIEGSLGTEINNPKNHWIYKSLIEKEFDGAKVWQWNTADNPYYPQDELIRLRESLDPRTFRQMFMIDWNVPGHALVYDDFDEANLTKGYVYNPDLETSVSIDWGWAHPMAVLFIQYDKKNDLVYVFDEIVSSRLTLDGLWDRIKSKNYRIDHWFCDIAGTQEREQSGRSNVNWFYDKYKIQFQYRSSAVNFGIPIVRSYIKNGLAQRKLIVDEVRCPRTVDGIRNYSYPEKDGVILNENPVKKDDDTNDALRYYFVNRLDKDRMKPELNNLNRFGKWR